MIPNAMPWGLPHRAAKQQCGNSVNINRRLILGVVEQRSADTDLHAAEFMDKFLKRKLDSDKSESSENKQL